MSDDEAKGNAFVVSNPGEAPLFCGRYAKPHRHARLPATTILDGGACLSVVLLPGEELTISVSGPPHEAPDGPEPGRTEKAD